MMHNHFQIKKTKQQKKKKTDQFTVIESTCSKLELRREVVYSFFIYFVCLTQTLETDDEHNFCNPVQ